MNMSLASLPPSAQTNLALRMLYFEDLSVGMTETFSKTFSSADVVEFAELTEIATRSTCPSNLPPILPSDTELRTASIPQV
jgi:hypothetical protein